MPKVKIQRATQKGKTWQVKLKNPKTGRQITISGGQKGVKTGKARSKATRQAFDARHGEPKTAKQYINKRLWDNAKVGDTITVPSKFF